MARIPLSLRSKLVFAFFMVLAPILVLLIYRHQEEYQHTKDSILQEQLRTAVAFGSAVEAELDQGVSVDKTLAIDPLIRNFANIHPDELQPYLARYLNLFPEYADIIIWGADGKPIAAAVGQKPGEPTLNIPNQPFFREALSAGTPTISQLFTSRLMEQPAVAILAPIKDESGYSIGVVSILLDICRATSNLQGAQPSQQQTIFTTDGSCRVVFHSARPGLGWEERDLSRYEPVRLALNQGQFVGIVEGDFTSEPHLVAASKTRSYGWVTAVMAPEELVLGPVRLTTLASLGVYLAIVFAALALALGFAYTVTRPLGRLIHAMAAFGGGDLHHRAQIQTGDELETAAWAFNRMAAELQQNQHRLNSLLELGTALASSADVPSIAKILAERSTSLLGEVSCVCILPIERQECQEMALHGPNARIRNHLQDLFRRHDPWIISNLYRPVLATGEPILITEIESSWLDERFRSALATSGVYSLLLVPLVGRRRIVGFLVNLSLSKDHRLQNADLALATDLGGRAGVLIDNALLFQQVHDEQARLQTILDTVPIAVVVAEGQEGQVAMTNRATRELLGDPPHPRIPIQQWLERFDLRRMDGKPYPPEHMPLVRSLTERQVIKGDEMAISTKDGRTVYLLSYSSPLPRERARPLGAVGAFLDVTPLKQAQRRAEDAAEESDRRRRELDAVIDGMAEGIIIADGEGRIQRINHRGREIWGISTVVGEFNSVQQYRDRLALFYPDGRPIPFEEWPIVRAMRCELFSGQEVVYDRADGQKLYLLFSSGVVRGDRGEVRLAVNIFGDITPIRELERAREEFISVVAHDLRSPLTVISGFAGILRSLKPEQHGQPQERKAVESILSSAKRLERMVADLLDASRIEARRLVLSLETVDLPKFVEEVVERSVEITSGHPVTVSTEPDLPNIQADPSRLEQILTNLLSNAAKYSYPNTEIVVEVGRRDGEALVSITNQGPGISPEEMEALFTRFRRTRAAAETRAPGLGLGLYITKGLVEAHSGRIWVESEAGKFTTFHFTLPLAVSVE